MILGLKICSKNKFYRYRSEVCQKYETKYRPGDLRPGLSSICPPKTLFPMVHDFYVAVRGQKFMLAFPLTKVQVCEQPSVPPTLGILPYLKHTIFLKCFNGPFVSRPPFLPPLTYLTNTFS